MNIAGIDPSTKCTAISIWDSSGDYRTTEVVVPTEKACAVAWGDKARPEEPRIARRYMKMDYIAVGAVDICECHDVEYAFIEDYLSHVPGDTNYLAENGKGIRTALLNAGIPWLAVDNGQWRKFVFNDGSLAKDLTFPKLIIKYGVTFDHLKDAQKGDAADAYCIALTAIAYLKYRGGVKQELIQRQWEVLNALKDKAKGIKKNLRKKRRTADAEW